MQIHKQKYFKNTIEFEKWISKNFNSSNGIWMLFYKKHTKVKCIDYSDALDIALCYGWIDSLVKRIDNETYVRKFTPRINTKNWSLINKKKVQVLLAQNRMKVAGLEKISPEILYGIKNNELTSETPKNDRQIPEFITDYINTNKVVKSNFYDLSAGRKSKFVAWICDAQKNETREKRLKAMTEMLISGKFDLLK